MPLSKKSPSALVPNITRTYPKKKILMVSPSHADALEYFNKARQLNKITTHAEKYAMGPCTIASMSREGYGAAVDSVAAQINEDIMNTNAPARPWNNQYLNGSKPSSNNNMLMRRVATHGKWTLLVDDNSALVAVNATRHECLRGEKGFVLLEDGVIFYYKHRALYKATLEEIMTETEQLEEVADKKMKKNYVDGLRRRLKEAEDSAE